MTIQLMTQRFGKSKATLQEALNEHPASVVFEDPNIRAPRVFNGSGIQNGSSFAVVMDHPKRQRFATVRRGTDGKFRVT